MKPFYRKIINLIPPKLSLVFIAIRHFVSDYDRILYTQKEVEKYLGEEAGMRDFSHSLKNYCLYYNLAGADKYIASYFKKADLVPINCKIKDSSCEKVILICCVKNDLKKIKNLYTYHKALGIKKMVFVDNASDDGTREWILEQGVDLFYTDEEYHAGAKAAWVRKIQDLYGYDRWYLILDSDELFGYIGMEKHSITEFIDKMGKLGIRRVQSILLDMYPRGELYSETDDNEYLNSFVFFDSTTYYYSRDGRGNAFRGGPRVRTFKNGDTISSTMSKYPLIFATKEDVWGDHYPIPFEKNFESPCYGILRHYKFTSGEYERYVNIAEEGHYYNGSSDYKVYIESGPKVTMYYEESQEYLDSESFHALPFVEEINWDEK